jgi:hypothetical protein
MTSTGIDYETSRVILLGTSTYDSSKLRNVPAVEHSMRGMHAMLTNPRYGGWPEDRVEYWLNHRGAKAVSQRLRKLARSTDGVLVFYFVGHGTMTEDQELCLMLPDTTDTDPDLTGLEFRQVSRALGLSNAVSKILILDCCYADSAIGSLAADSPELESTPGTYTLTATNRLQQRAVWSGQDDGTPTAFTGELLNLIHAGKDDGPERLSLDDLYPVLWKRLTGLALPKPKNVASDMAVRQPFTLNAAYPHPDSNGIIPPPFVIAPQRTPGRFAWPQVQPLSRRNAMLGGAALLGGGILAAGTVAAREFWPHAKPPPTAPPNLRLSNVYGLDSGQGSSYRFAPNDHADQAFRSAMPYIDRAGVIVGLDPRNQSVTTHTLEIQVLNSAGTVLGDGLAELVNNANTTVTLPDIRTNSNEIYRIRVWNRSEDVLGIYLNKASGASTNVGPASINGVPQSGIIAGFVEGRNLPAN